MNVTAATYATAVPNAAASPTAGAAVPSDAAAPGASSATADLVRSRWHLYDRLIAGVPEDVLVTRACLGAAWSYVEAECGMGVAMTVSGGASMSPKRAPIVGRPLREVAGLSKSWNFGEATLGVAALNAWYSRRELLDPMGATYDDEGERPDGHERAADAFAMYAQKMAGAKVYVVGHFPHVERIAADRGGILTVLERNCTAALDTPDPACEYLIPEQDYLFMTGITLTNKTMTRLLELARMRGRATGGAERTHTVLVGPSVIPSPALFDEGVECLAGSVVADPDGVRALVERGAGQLFGSALLMFDCFAPGMRG